MLTASERLQRYATAFAGIDAPFAFVDLDAMWSNSDDMLRRSAGKPIRVASKSLRCRALLGAVLQRDAGYRGLLTFTLPETLWLASEGFGDLVVAYPSTDRGALRELAALTADDPDGAPVLMVDSREHLDLIERRRRRGRRTAAGLPGLRRLALAGGRPREDRAQAHADPHAPRRP